MESSIVWDSSKQRYYLKANDKLVMHSKDLNRLQRAVSEQWDNVRQFGITSYKLVNVPKQMTATTPDNKPVAPIEQFSINERFQFMGDLAKMVIERKARALIVGGSGGIGKTHTVLQAFKDLGKVDCASFQAGIEELDPINPEDDEEEIEDKVLSEMSMNRGDYVVVKGHASVKSLFRLLWVNRNRTIVFDDCDSILREAAGLLKPALDTYDDRYVSWLTEAGAADSDLPRTFKFNGSIIFITNMPLEKIDEAVRTRCFKVDASMTFAQRIERMESVLDDVMPDVDLSLKQESLQLLKDNLHRCKDINFRTLMNIINIRTNAGEGWKRLAEFALLTN